jgi:hypothetical protein
MYVMQKRGYSHKLRLGNEHARRVWPVHQSTIELGSEIAPKYDDERVHDRWDRWPDRRDVY